MIKQISENVLTLVFTVCLYAKLQLAVSPCVYTLHLSIYLLVGSLQQFFFCILYNLLSFAIHVFLRDGQCNHLDTNHWVPSGDQRHRISSAGSDSFSGSSTCRTFPECLLGRRLGGIRNRCLFFWSLAKACDRWLSTGTQAVV